VESDKIVESDKRELLYEEIKKIRGGKPGTDKGGISCSAGFMAAWPVDCPIRA
jgi:hypothetical protein